MDHNKNQNFLTRLKFATSGIKYALLNEKSFRTHLILTALLLLLIFILRPSVLWISLFSGCVALVLSLELLNSAIESLADAICADDNPQIKTAKDCAAGAVLIASGCSLIIFTLFLFSRFS